MDKDQNFVKLEELLEKIGTAAEKEEDVSLGDIMKILGRRSFGPMLLIAGLIILAPSSEIFRVYRLRWQYSFF